LDRLTTILKQKQVPKLLWIKHHIPSIYHDSSTRYFDLADYLSLRLTKEKEKDDVRSLCCVGAKWMYDTEHGQW
jgi:ribulose kinase